MDEIDLAILKELTSDHALLFAGLNPRLSPERIARALVMDPSSIRARIRQWKERGFLLGFHVLPNPTVLGLRHFVGYAVAPDPATRPAVLEALELVDGLVCSLDHIHGLVGMGFYAESPADVTRRMELVARLPGVTSTLPPFQPFAQPDAGPLDRTDHRILRTLREDPHARASDLAEKVGVGVNTWSARYAKLVERGALWSVASLDFTRFIGGVFARGFLDLDPRADLSKLADAITLTIRPPAFVRRAALGGPGEKQKAHVMVVLDSVAQVEDFERGLRALDGVESVRMMFPRAYRVHRRWIDERIRAAEGSERTAA